MKLIHLLTVISASLAGQSSAACMAFAGPSRYGEAVGSSAKEIQASFKDYGWDRKKAAAFKKACRQERRFEDFDSCQVWDCRQKKDKVTKVKMVYRTGACDLYEGKCARMMSCTKYVGEDGKEYEACVGR